VRIGERYTLMRFKVEKIAARAWMIWDTATQTVAVIDGMLAAGLSYNEAMRLGEKLNKFDRELRRMKAMA
jgi:hypothetical protein